MENITHERKIHDRPKYLIIFLAAGNFSDCTEQISNLINEIKNAVHNAPVADNMHQIVPIFQNTYFQIDRFCAHVAPLECLPHAPKIKNYGYDYEDIWKLWNGCYCDAKQIMQQFEEYIKILRQKWQNTSAQGDIKLANEYAKATYYWGTVFLTAKKFLECCDRNTERLVSLAPEK